MDWEGQTDRDADIKQRRAAFLLIRSHIPSSVMHCRFDAIAHVSVFGTGALCPAGPQDSGV